MLGLLLVTATFEITRNASPSASRVVIVGMWIFSLAFLVGSAFDLLASRRFRLEIGPEMITYRGIFSEMSFPRAALARLATGPWARGAPGSLLFYDSAKRMLLSVDRSLITADQEAEISSALGIPVERPSH